MDLNLSRDTVRINEPVFEGTAEHSIDCEIILPDYCPDIARILKSESCVSIDSKVIESNRMTLNGNLCIRIIYIPENSSSIRCVTHNSTFNHDFDVRELSPNMFSKVKANVVFMNCRPIGPRKAQVKASVSIAAKVWKDREESFISDCDDENVELQKKTMKACSLVGAAEKQMKVNDELEIPHSKPAASSIIRSNAITMVQDYKVISNKIIVKGEALIHTLYTSDAEDNRLEVMEHSIPISHIIDLEGVDEDCSCDVHFIMDDIRVDIESDADGENRIITVELTCTAIARAYREQEYNAISDAFCISHNMDLKHKQMNIEHINSIARYSQMLRLSIELGSTDTVNIDIASITDCTAIPNIMNVKFDGNEIVIEGSMAVSIMASESQGSPICIEKALPFVLKEGIINKTEVMRCEPELTVTSVAYSMMGIDKIDLRIECVLEAAIFGVSYENVIVEMVVDDSSEKECVPRKTLTLYFADKGENIWDIAKRYNTSMNAIKRENNLEDDVLCERSMLLIPKARCRSK
jgi:hypothetical protein